MRFELFLLIGLCLGTAIDDGLIKRGSKNAPKTCDISKRYDYVNQALGGSFRMITLPRTQHPDFWSKQAWINYNIAESILMVGATLSDKVSTKRSDTMLGMATDRGRLSGSIEYLWKKSYGSFGTDDYGWKALLGIAAHKYLVANNHDSDYLDQAKDIFDKYLDTKWDTTKGGGGVLWKLSGDNYRATISTQLYMSIAAMLFDADQEKNKDYLKKAEKAYEWLWTFEGLRSSAGLFYDGFHLGEKSGDKPEIATGLYTYNQGVALSGLGLLYKHTKDEKYLKSGTDLVGAMFSKDGMSDGLVIAENCDKDVINTLKDKNNGKGGLYNYCNEDQSYFKGVYMKHLMYFLRNIPQETADIYRNFVQANANAAWSAALNKGSYDFSPFWIGTDLDGFNKLKNSYRGCADGMVYDAIIASVEFGNGYGC